MNSKFTAPPAYVWDRIEKILDEQDGRKRTEKLFENTSTEPVVSKRQNFFVRSVTGMSLLLLIVLKYSPGLKIN